MARQEETSQQESCSKRKRTVHEFCENTSIHGLKYIFEEGSFFLERIAWVLVFFSGICFSGYFCWQMYQKWEQSPVLTSVETQLYPLKNVSFPAVTICNVNKISQQKLKDYRIQNPKFWDVPYSKLQWTLRYMTKLDRGIKSENDLKDLDKFYDDRNITAKELFVVLEETAPKCSNDIIMDCSWQGRPCTNYISFLPTDDGMCCTFNSETEYDPLTGLETKVHEPLRVSGNGYRMGLSLVIDAKVDDYSVTTGKFDGFKVLVHSSGDFPDVADRGFVLGPGTETFVGVKWTTSFHTEEVANEVNSKNRKCLVEGEKILKFHDTYSQSACFVECAGKIMQENCSCRPYFFRGDKNTSLCDLNKYTCIANVYENVRLRGVEICDCLPPCTDTLYEPEISYASFPGRGFNLTRTFKRLVDQRNLSDGTDSNAYFKSNVAMLHVYYKEKTGMRYRTDIRFGIEDLISAMGGLLGLGLGMSFISVIELLYYVFVRRFLIRRRSATQSDERSNLVQNPHPSRAVPEIKKIWPDWPIESISTTTISTLIDSSLNNLNNPRLVRRGSLNLPTQIQARLYKY